MSTELERKLARQPDASTDAGSNSNRRGLKMRVLQVPVTVNDWTVVLPNNPARQFLLIQARPGENGPLKMEIGFDSRSRSDVFNVEGDRLEFAGGIAPTNAINVYVTSEYADTFGSLQVIEG